MEMTASRDGWHCFAEMDDALQSCILSGFLCNAKFTFLVWWLGVHMNLWVGGTLPSRKYFQFLMQRMCKSTCFRGRRNFGVGAPWDDPPIFNFFSIRGHRRQAPHDSDHAECVLFVTDCLSPAATWTYFIYVEIGKL